MEEHSPLLTSMKSVGPEKCLRSLRKKISMSWGPIGGQTHPNDIGEAGRAHFSSTESLRLNNDMNDLFPRDCPLQDNRELNDQTQ
eukprot:13883260-Heterocapsa_arctica.AAC.1